MGDSVMGDSVTLTEFRNSVNVTETMELFFRICGQQDVIAESRFQAFDGASFVLATGSTTGAEGANHVTVDHDGNPARNGRESELHPLSCQSARIALQLRQDK